MASHTAGLPSAGLVLLVVSMARYHCWAEGLESTLSPGLPSRAVIWSEPRSLAMSASPCSTSSRRVTGSATFLRMTLASQGVPPGALGLASSTSASLGWKVLMKKEPVPAEWVLSQPLPRSPAASWPMASFWSTMEATGAVRMLKAKPGPTFCGQDRLTLPSSTFFRKESTFSGVQPSSPRMKAGPFLSFTARDRENITSSGRTGLPLVKAAPGLSLKTRLEPSAPTFHLAPRAPCSSVIFAGLDSTRRW